MSCSQWGHSLRTASHTWVSCCRGSGTAHKEAGGDDATVTREVQSLHLDQSVTCPVSWLCHARNAFPIACASAELPHVLKHVSQGREATREAVGSGLEQSVDLAFKTAQRQAELRDAKRQEAAAQANERRMTFQQRVRILPAAVTTRAAEVLALQHGHLDSAT